MCATTSRTRHSVHSVGASHCSGVRVARNSARSARSSRARRIVSGSLVVALLMPVRCWLVVDPVGVAVEQGGPAAAAVDGAVDVLAVDEALEVAVFDLDGGLGGAVGVEADLD